MSLYRLLAVLPTHPRLRANTKSKSPTEDLSSSSDTLVGVTQQREHRVQPRLLLTGGPGKAVRCRASEQTQDGKYTECSGGGFGAANVLPSRTILLPPLSYCARGELTNMEKEF